MRDPNRIPMVLAAVGRAWTERPDERLGQLLNNAVVHDNVETPLYYLEDGALLGALAKYADIELSAEAQVFVQEEPERRRQGWRKFFTDAERYFGFR